MAKACEVGTASRVSEFSLEVGGFQGHGRNLLLNTSLVLVLLVEIPQQIAQALSREVAAERPKTM